MPDNTTRYDIEAVGEFWAKLAVQVTELKQSVDVNLRSWQAADAACQNANFVTEAHKVLQRASGLVETMEEAIEKAKQLHREASEELADVAKAGLF